MLGSAAAAALAAATAARAARIGLPSRTRAGDLRPSLEEQDMMETRYRAFQCSTCTNVGLMVDDKWLTQKVQC